MQIKHTPASCWVHSIPAKSVLYRTIFWDSSCLSLSQWGKKFLGPREHSHPKPKCQFLWALRTLQFLANVSMLLCFYVYAFTCLSFYVDFLSILLIVFSRRVGLMQAKLPWPKVSIIFGLKFHSGWRSYFIYFARPSVVVSIWTLIILHSFLE